MRAVLSTSSSFDCREAEPLIHLYADGEAAPEDASLLEEHLEVCSDCGERLKQRRAIKRALAKSAAAHSEPSADFVLRLRGDLKAAGQRERRRRRVLVMVPALAAAGVLVVVGFTFGVNDRGDERGGLEQGAPPLLDETLSLHTLDVPVDVASPDPVRVGAFLASRIGHPVRVPRLDRAGFGLAGGRVISVNNQRAAHLVYEGGLGRRVSLLAVPDPSGALSARVLGGARAAATSSASFSGWVKGHDDDSSAHLRARRGELGVHVWSDKGSVFSLAGQVDDAHLDQLLATLASERGPAKQRVARDFDPPVR